jgi:Cu2+-exporting ATPase
MKKQHDHHAMDMDKMPEGTDHSKMHKGHDAHMGMSEHDHIS